MRGECRGGETMPEGATRAKERSLQRKKPARRQKATAPRRVRELRPWVVAAGRARDAQTMAQQRLERKGVEERAAAGEEWGPAQGAQMSRAAGAQWMGRAERAGVSGRRQTETREETVGEKSEHECNLRNVNTIGKGTSARSAEGRASASTLGKGTGARSAEGGASASTIGKGTGARIAGGRASVSTLG